MIGGFELTIDVVFDDPAVFERVKGAMFTRLYGVCAEDALFTVYDAALAFKATLPRLVPAGDISDTHVYGARQHGPLARCRHPVLSSLPPLLRPP
jgi:Domain of unknown function (DUF4387)